MGTTAALHALPPTSQELVAAVDRQTLDVTVWQRLLQAVAAPDPAERVGLPGDVAGLNFLAAAVAEIRRAVATAEAALPAGATAGDVHELSGPARRQAYAAWLPLSSLHPEADQVLTLLRGALHRYPALADLDSAAASARAAVLGRTPEVYADVFLRAAYQRTPLRAPLTASQRFELGMFERVLRRDGFEGAVHRDVIAAA